MTHSPRRNASGIGCIMQYPHLILWPRHTVPVWIVQVTESFPIIVLSAFPWVLELEIEPANSADCS